MGTDAESCNDEGNARSKAREFRALGLLADRMSLAISAASTAFTNRTAFA